MILLIDNYDSFTYNLYQYLRELGAVVRVRRNDALTMDQVARLRPRGIVLSPGPGRPEGAGVCLEVIRRFAPKIPILGVCLGHQAVAAAFGAAIGRGEPCHGKARDVMHERSGLFRGLPSPFRACRYHSLVVLPDSL